MPKTLSTDLRERIVRHVGEGHSRRSAAEKFAVSPSSAVRIVARHAATGSVAAKVGRVGRRSKLDAHRDYLVRRIAEAADITMPELAAELAARGVRIDPSTDCGRNRAAQFQRGPGDQRRLRAGRNGVRHVADSRVHAAQRDRGSGDHFAHREGTAGHLGPGEAGADWRTADDRRRVAGRPGLLAGGGGDVPRLRRRRDRAGDHPDRRPDGE